MPFISNNLRFIETTGASVSSKILAAGGRHSRNLKNVNSYYRNCYGIYTKALEGTGKTFHVKRMLPNLSAQKQTHQVEILLFHA